MTKRAEEPIVSFEFVSSTGEMQPLVFSKPVDVISANTLEEVLTSLERVLEAVSKGYYAAGFLTYESAPAFDSAYQVKQGSSMPLLWFGIYTKPLNRSLGSSGAYHLSNWTPSETVEEYHAKILSIKQSIERGEIDQTNYTIRLLSAFQGDDIAYFTRLKKAQRSHYCAYVNTGEHRILSASPELFFRLENGKVTVRPMKGTIKRGNTVEEDRANAEWLYHSEKNRAENRMIVDLFKKDLSKIAKPGTVQVEKLFEIEHYPTVHQMTSTMTAVLADHVQLLDIFHALFPSGSITGTPKIDTMKIIADLESSPREVYCGAMGYITPDHEAIFNVPIRTVIIDSQTGLATYGVGGAITSDSTAEEEYQEALIKANCLTWKDE